MLYYVSDSIFNETSILSEFLSISLDLEQLWISIEVPNVKKKIIGLAYRPPGGNVDRCLESLRLNLEKIQSEMNSEITVVGDLNINYNTRNTSPFKLLKEIERDFGLKQLITKPTRITPTSSTPIDLILTDSNNIMSSGVLDICISDHLPIFYIRKKTREHNPKKKVKGRSYKRYEKDNYQHDIINDNRWTKFWDESSNVDIMWDVFHEIIVDHASQHCPVIDLYVNEKCPYWFSRDLIEEINYKNFLYKQAKCSGKTDDWDKFKNQKNLVKGLIFRAKNNYVTEQLDTNLNDSRKLWKNISVLSGLGRNKRNIGMTEVENGIGEVVNGQAAADYMNDFYTSVGPTINKTFKEDWDQNSFKLQTDTIFDFEFITETQVRKLVEQVDMTKSAALGDLSTRIVKDAFSCLTVELTHLYNFCIDNSVFPLKWGLGIVCPIPKTKNNSKHAKDWRPITQISLPGKILERILHTQLSNYLEVNNLLYNNQHGFRPGKSTTSAVFGTLKRLFENWNIGLASTCVFVDFSRAFDSIDHEIF